MKQEIIDLYDEFTHRGLDRRVFMSRLADLAGGTAAAATALSLLRADPAGAAMVAPDDPRLDADTVTIRERDSMQQERVRISEVAKIVSERTDMRKLLEEIA